MLCSVCEAAEAYDEHHIIPQASGGTAGPLFDLCPSCHDLVHRSVNMQKRGKSPELLWGLIKESGRIKLEALVTAALIAETNNGTQKRPLLAVVLDDKRYLDALHLYKKDRGFTSINSTVNAMLRTIADHYFGKKKG